MPISSGRPYEPLSVEELHSIATAEIEEKLTATWLVADKRMHPAYFPALHWLDADDHQWAKSNNIVGFYAFHKDGTPNCVIEAIQGHPRGAFVYDKCAVINHDDFIVLRRHVAALKQSVEDALRESSQKILADLAQSRHAVMAAAALQVDEEYVFTDEDSDIDDSASYIPATYETF